MIWVAAHWEKQEKRLKSRRDDPVLTHTKRGEGTAPSQNLFLLLCRGLRLVGLGLLLNRQQLHFKNQRRVRTNIPARASLRVSQRRGNEQLPLRSHRHQLQRFCPALDHSIYRKRCRLATLIRAIEFRAVDETPAGPAALAAAAMAVICGMPAPETTRVVQMEPGPMPTFTAETPAATRSAAPSCVPTLP